MNSTAKYVVYTDNNDRMSIWENNPLRQVAGPFTKRAEVEAWIAAQNPGKGLENFHKDKDGNIHREQ